MSSPAQYIEFVLFQWFKSGAFDKILIGENAKWQKESLARGHFRSAAVEAFQPYASTIPVRIAGLAEAAFDKMVEEGVFDCRSIPYGATYVRTTVKKKDDFLDRRLSTNEASDIVADLGLEVLEDVFSNLSNLEDWGLDIASVDSSSGASASVPASDRLVSIDHNRQGEIEDPLNEVVDLVEAENSIDGEDGLRELVLGRLKAGRELIRAGVFTVKSLQLTLVVGLQMLVEKYGDTAIAIVAAKLLDLLLTQYGIG